ncbi:MAG: transposase [Lachnospiraceae bacterium]|nr:transposase [Lachnospiraceae bacterium]
MWIAGGNKPDFRTINRFRLDMMDIIEDIFYEVIKLLLEKKYIKLQNYFLNGTKIEANANRYIQI